MPEELRGLTAGGAKIVCKTVQHLSVNIPIVDYNDGEGLIRFVFNPDFPQDAQAFFQALEKVQEIIVEE